MPVALGGLFLTAAFAATTTGVIVAGIIGGAIIGAAIGGITAAITGGSIGKGILFGAIGGAVTGGIGAWMSGAGTAGAVGGVTGSTSVSASESAAAGQIGAKAAGSAIVGQTASSGGSGALGGMSQGMGTAVAAGVTTVGSAVAGAFDDSAAIAEKTADKNRASSEKLAQLQADTQLKIAEMSGGGGGGGGSNGDARYTADLQLKNAREQRSQDYKMKSEEYALMEEQRARRAGAVSGVMAAGPQAPQSPTNAPSIDEQAYQQSNQMYAQQQPAAAQNINQTQQAGVMQAEPVYA